MPSIKDQYDIFRRKLRNARPRTDYHFDPKVQESPHKNVGRFESQMFQGLCQAWMSGMPADIALDKTLPYWTYGKLVDEDCGFSQILKENTDRYCPLIKRMVAALGMESPGIILHAQRSGQTLPMHLDEIGELRKRLIAKGIDDPHEHPETIGRFNIMLSDWEPGHFWQFGNASFSQWRAGDIVWHDWFNTPHCTANATFSPRLSLIVTGIVTDKTKAILESDEPLIIQV